MFKTVWIMRRNPAMTREEFIDYYETKHSKFIKYTPGAQKYIRRYPRVLSKLGEETAVAPLAFDVMMEIWWDDRASYEADMDQFDSTVLPTLQEDEAKLFDRGSEGWCTIVLVDVEHETDLSSPTFDSTYEVIDSA